MKHNAVALLRSFGVLRIARELQRARCAVLTYHGVLSGSDDCYDFLNHNFVAADAFERQLRYLTQHYRPISLFELCRAYDGGAAPPARSVALTFDDGFANNFTVAFPLLQKYSFPFTVFLSTGLIDRPGAQLWSERVKRAIYMCPGASVRLPLNGESRVYSLSTPAVREESARAVLQRLKRMAPAGRDAGLATVEAICGRPALKPEERDRYDFLTWSQVREMASAGVEFGSHTVTHPILSTLDEAGLQLELVESKRRIEDELKRECYAFAFPNGAPGDFGPREQRALRAAGYRCAFSLTGTLNGARRDLFALDRINVGRQFDPATFESALTGVLAGARRVRVMLSPSRFGAAGSAHTELRTQ